MNVFVAFDYDKKVVQEVFTDLTKAVKYCAEYPIDFGIQFTTEHAKSLAYNEYLYFFSNICIIHKVIK